MEASVCLKFEVFPCITEKNSYWLKRCSWPPSRLRTQMLITLLTGQQRTLEWQYKPEKSCQHARNRNGEVLGGDQNTFVWLPETSFKICQLEFPGLCSRRSSYTWTSGKKLILRLLIMKIVELLDNVLKGHCEDSVQQRLQRVSTTISAMLQMLRKYSSCFNALYVINLSKEYQNDKHTNLNVKSWMTTLIRRLSTNFRKPSLIKQQPSISRS